jgi:hypothetical protein
MCEYRPCWGTPKEIKKLIEAGYAGRLMNDYWVGDGHNGDDIQIVSPSTVGSEGGHAPFFPIGNCTFLKDGLCEINSLKPIEARINFGCKDSGVPDSHSRIALLWNTRVGREVVALWRKSNG